MQEFSLKIMQEIFSLHSDLKNKTYQHSQYEAFKINDPKPRDIHKTSVRDRLLHHALFKILYPYFDKRFIAHSYSSRKSKGTHRALIMFKKMCNKVSKNNTKTVLVLKCDIRKFFASIDHQILKDILKKYIHDTDTLNLLNNIIDSFHTVPGKGLPLGNLTSQLLVNVYMNEFDQWVKYKLKAKYYIRYADDFVVLSTDKTELERYLENIHIFLDERLRLQIHPNKVSITTPASGVDFLGWVHFPKHRVLRTVTKQRMFKNLKKKEYANNSVQSYLGMLKHGNSYSLSCKVLREKGNNVTQQCNISKKR